MWSKRGAVCLLALTTCCCWLATAAQQQQQDTDAAVPTTTLSSSLSTTTAGNHSESDSQHADGESLQNGRARSQQQQQPAGTGSVCGRDGDCPALLACLAGTCQDPCTALPCPLDGAHCKGGHQQAYNVCTIFKKALSHLNFFYSKSRRAYNSVGKDIGSIWS